MKYAATIDMDAVKKEALAELDLRFSIRRTTLLGPNADIHRVKYLEARDGREMPILKSEARLKGVSVDELASEVWEKGQEMTYRLGQLEAERQSLQTSIRAAKCPADISKIMKGVL